MTKVIKSHSTKEHYITLEVKTTNFTTFNFAMVKLIFLAMAKNTV